MKIKITTHSYEETMGLGMSLARLLPSGSTALLTGDLGAGKTTLVRGVARGLHINELVQSPTFNIMKLYLKGDRALIHIDAYRLKDIEQDIGLDEYIGYEQGLTFIEWPEYIENLLPKEVMNIEIHHINDDVRDIEITYHDEKVLGELKK